MASATSDGNTLLGKHPHNGAVVLGRVKIGLQARMAPALITVDGVFQWQQLRPIGRMIEVTDSAGLHRLDAQWMVAKPLEVHTDRRMAAFTQYIVFVSQNLGRRRTVRLVTGDTIAVQERLVFVQP